MSDSVNARPTAERFFGLEYPNRVLSWGVATFLAPGSKRVGNFGYTPDSHQAFRYIRELQSPMQWAKSDSAAVSRLSVIQPWLEMALSLPQVVFGLRGVSKNNQPATRTASLNNVVDSAPVR